MEYAEKLAAKPWFLIVFNTILIALWLTIGTDIANIFISIITAELVLLGLGANKRSNLAVHVKLDELIAANEEARNELTHLEEKDEKTILEIRK